MRIKLAVPQMLRVGLALTALSAFTVVAAPSASAAKPEILGGPTAFTVSGSSITMQLPTKEVSSCSKISGSGMITGKKTGTITLTLAHCGTLIGYCHGKGMGLEEFKTVELEMTPVYTKPGGGVGLELRPKVGNTFAELVSGFGSSCELKGSLIAPIPQYFLGFELPLGFSGRLGEQTPFQYETESHEIVNSQLEFRALSTQPFQKESWNGVETKLKTTRQIEIYA